MKNRMLFKQFGITLVAFAMCLFFAPSVAKAAPANGFGTSISTGILAQAKYVNPYTKEGRLLNAERVDEQWTWLIGGVFVLVAIILIMMILLRNQVNHFLIKEKVRKGAPAEEVEKATWTELFLKPERDRPLDAPIEGHNYDGIVELDNNPPAWFNWLFFLPILWGFFYIMYFHVLNIGELQAGEYETEVQLAEVENVKREEARAKDIESLEALTGEEDLALGAQIFSINCAACHKADGGGSVGPNLTDNSWLHGGDFKSIYGTVYNGVPAKGMQAWGKKLKFKEILQVSSYIDQQLRNTNAEGGKTPEGEVYAGN